MLVDYTMFWTFLICGTCVSLSTTCNDANTSLSFNNPFVSVWMDMEAQTDGPFHICHNLGVNPIKVEVQVKVQTQNNGEQIFSGVGSAQRDDDMDVPYGGIVYLYNTTHVILFVPKDTQEHRHTDKGTLAYTGHPAFKGAFIGSFTKAEVRIKAWDLQGLGTTQFETKVSFSISKGYLDVSHDIGRRPDYVTVQVEFSKDEFSYIAEAEGVNFHSKHINKKNLFGGILFAYNDTSIRLWTPKDGFLFFANDGWGTESFRITEGMVTIRAWASNIIISEHNVSRYVHSDDSTDDNDHVITFDQHLDVNKYLTVVQVNPLEPENNHYVFHGVGTALTDGSFGEYGGVVYAYNQTHTLLWLSSSSSKHGYMAYVGGAWIRHAEQTVVSSRAKIVTKIINLADSRKLCPKQEIVDIVETEYIMGDIPDTPITGANVTYDCKINHRLVSGDLNRTCLFNGKWSGKAPICKRCQCPCTKIRQQVTIKTKQELESRMAAKRKSLAVTKSNLSTQIRKKTSAKDKRPSAASIGIVLGLGIILTIALVIVISDIPLIF